MDLQKDNYERLLASDNSHIIVAESNDVIGVLGFEVQNDLYNGKKKAFINSGAVELAHQKKGIYGTLVNIVKDFARKNEIATIELTCAMHRSNSHKFYFNNDCTIKKTFVFINEVK